MCIRDRDHAQTACCAPVATGDPHVSHAVDRANVCGAPEGCDGPRCYTPQGRRGGCRMHPMQECVMRAIIALAAAALLAVTFFPTEASARMGGGGFHGGGFHGGGF